MKDVLEGISPESVMEPFRFKIYLNNINNIGLYGKIFVRQIFMYADDLCVLYLYNQDLIWNG